MSVKHLVLAAIQQLPDDADFHDVSEEIALLAAVQKAEAEISAGRVVSHEDMKSRMEGWFTN